MLKIYDQYLLKQFLVSTLVIAGGLSMIILLTQSLRLIELVLESNASAESFMTLMALSLPRFFEAVLPASVLIATLFTFHRLAMDSEMIVLRASGASPWRLARPVLSAGAVFISGLLILSLWVSPVGISKMQTLRKEIRAQYAHLLFREGVFNTVGTNLTAYVHQRAQDGRLVGLMVHDTRQIGSGGPAVTIVARSGNIVSEDSGQKIIVYDGSRQERDPKAGKFSRLDFKQYTLDMPESEENVGTRWREPDERTISELAHPSDMTGVGAQELKEFRAELHRRFSTPLLMLSFAMISAACLLLGPFSRAGQMPLIIVAALGGLFLQGTYLLAFSLAKKSLMGCMLLYGIAGAPIAITLFLFSPWGERFITRAGNVYNRLLHHDDGIKSRRRGRR